MTKWIYILRLLGSDIETGEIAWHEAVRAENLSFQVCIENVVDTVETLGQAGIRHEVFCKEMPAEETVEEKDDK
jgi:hypothetical protein